MLNDRQMEADFGRRMHSVLSPSQTIQSMEFLRGRAVNLDDIRRATYSPGRQVFIHGPRGVGKSSLAQTAAYELQSADAEPIVIICTRGNTCFEIVQQIVKRAIPSDPRLIRRTIQKSASAGIKALSVTSCEQIEKGAVPLPGSLNDCAQLLELILAFHSKLPVIIIDEFEQITDKAQQLLFANLVKMIGDTHLRMSLIFCGIGEAIDDLFNAHSSAHRYFHAAQLGRLEYHPRLEIIDCAVEALNIDIDATTRFRIATVSDGFPHFVHLICEKLFWRVFRAQNGMRTTPELFEVALNEAVAAIDPELKKPYEKATKKYTNDCEPILWAVSDGEEFERPSRDIFASYERIMQGLGQEPLERQDFNNRMASLKKASHGSILSGTRQGWYGYSEKILRAYARLRAMQSAVKLEREHPLEPRRFGGIIGYMREQESTARCF